MTTPTFDHRGVFHAGEHIDLVVIPKSWPSAESFLAIPAVAQAIQGASRVVVSSDNASLVSDLELLKLGGVTLRTEVKGGVLAVRTIDSVGLLTEEGALPVLTEREQAFERRLVENPALKERMLRLHDHLKSLLEKLVRDRIFPVEDFRRLEALPDPAGRVIVMETVIRELALKEAGLIGKESLAGAPPLDQKVLKRCKDLGKDVLVAKQQRSAEFLVETMLPSLGLASEEELAARIALWEKGEPFAAFQKLVQEAKRCRQLYAAGRVAELGEKGEHTATEEMADQILACRGLKGKTVCLVPAECAHEVIEKLRESGLAVSRAKIEPEGDEAKGILLKIRKEGKTVGYLVGTVHVATKEMMKLAAKLRSKLLKSDRLFLEIDLEELAGDAWKKMLHPKTRETRAENEALLTQLFEQVERLKGETVGEVVVDDELISRFRKAVQRKDLTALLSLVQILAQYTDQMRRAMIGGAKSEGSIEESVYGYALSHGIELGAFESVEWQNALLAKLGKEAVSREDVAVKPPPSSIVEAYRRGDLIDLEAKSFDVRENPTVFRDRNFAMAERIEEEIALGHKNTYAVGFGHLFGEEGLMALLRARGYTVG